MELFLICICILLLVLLIIEKVNHHKNSFHKDFQRPTEKNNDSFIYIDEDGKKILKKGCFTAIIATVIILTSFYIITKIYYFYNPLPDNIMYP